MTDHVKAILANQFDAALCMLNDCVEKCPNALWDAPVAKYPYWLVTHHVLCFVDLYLSPTDASFVPREKFHPAGRRAFEDEYPSRRFERAEILEYIVICRQKAHDVFANATDASLLAPSGFARRPATRLELHLYNLRHLQHHVGQLGAALRRADASIDPRWIGSGWK